MVKLASVAARIASALHMQPENDVPEAIKNGSLYTDILKEHWRHRLLDFDLISFWEADEKVRQCDCCPEASKLTAWQIVSRESASFGIPGDREGIIELKAGHSDLCRFDISKKDGDLLKRVRFPIQELYEKALAKGESTAVHSESDTELERRLAALRAPV